MKMYCRPFPHCIGSANGKEIAWIKLAAGLIISKQRKANQKPTPNVHDSVLPQEDIGCVEQKAKLSSGEVLSLFRQLRALVASMAWDLLSVKVTARSLKITAWSLMKFLWTSKSQVQQLEEYPLYSNQSDEALQHRIWYKEDTEEKDPVLFQRTVDLVAVRTQEFLSYIDWKVIPSEIHDLLESEVSGIIMRLALSVLDLDDILWTEKCSEYETLFKELTRLTKDVCTWKETCKKPYQLAKAARAQRQCDVWLRFAEPGGDPKAFVGLNEVDVAYIISYGCRSDSAEGVRSQTPDRIPESCNAKFTKLVSDVMETFVPLKMEYKVQLNLEVSEGYSFRVLDYLFMEACKDLVSVELLDHIETRLNLSTDKTEEILSSFLQMVYDGMIITIFHPKVSQMKHFGLSVVHTMSAGFFGRFDREVLMVIEMADHERRVRCHRFLSVDHILLVLSFSRFGKWRHVKKEILKNYSPDVPPKVPAYKVYKWAGDCAKHFIEDNADGMKPAGLEHLAMAVIAVKRKDRTFLWNAELMQGLKNDISKDSSLGDQVVKIADLKYKDKPMQDFKTLIHAIINNGLDLPEIRCQAMDTAKTGCLDLPVSAHGPR